MVKFTSQCNKASHMLLGNEPFKISNLNLIILIEMLQDVLWIFIFLTVMNIFNFDDVSLSIFSFVDYDVGFLSKNLVPNMRTKRFSLRFSSVLHFTFTYMICFVYFCIQDGNRLKFIVLCLWISSCLALFVEKQKE